MNQKIIIIGAGGHAAELNDYITYQNLVSEVPSMDIVGLLDDDKESYTRYDYEAPFLGKITDHDVRTDVQYLMGIANLKYRKHFIEAFKSKGGKFASLIHPSALISGSAKLGEGVVIAPNASLGPNVVIGDFTLLNARCSIGHDTVLGKYNFISPNVCFSGFTVVGNENLFGINSATIPGIKVGSRNKITAGMVLDKPVGDDTTVFFRMKERVMAISGGKKHN